MIDARLRFPPGGRPQTDRFAQNISGSDVDEAKAVAQELRLGALAAARRSNEDQAHGSHESRVRSRESEDQ